MQDAIINYFPELIGGIIIAFVSFWLTRLNERAKARNLLEHKQELFEQEKERVRLEYDAKLKEQQLKFNHEKSMLKEQHKLEIEKYKIESQDRDLKSIFTGEYNIDEISKQMDDLMNLAGKAEEMNKIIKSKKNNHPAKKRR